MEDPAKATFAFSKLTAINSRRSARYTAAADKVKPVHLKIVFLNYAFLAQQLHADLMRWVEAYGGTVQPHTSSLISDAWEKIKDLFSADTEVFSACEQLEEEALKNYRTALVLNFLPEAAVKDIARQLQEIQKIKDSLADMKQRYIGTPAAA